MAPSPHPHASADNLQTRRAPGGMTSSAWQTGARVALFGMIVNSIFAGVKILVGVFGHEYVLIADGIESGLDVAGSFVIWSGLKVAARPPDASHPYGHGKAEPIAAMIVAVGVLAAAVGLAIQSVREIFLPHHAPAPYTLVILVVVIVIKETLFRYVFVFHLCSVRPPLRPICPNRDKGADGNLAMIIRAFWAGVRALAH